MITSHSQSLVYLRIEYGSPKELRLQNLYDSKPQGGKNILSCNHAPLTLQYLKNGAPRSLRAKLWAQVLGSELKPGDAEYFKTLKERVLHYDLIIDKLIIKDVQLTASNDHQFFVFEDVLYQIMLCFSRDPEVLSIFNSSSASPVSGIIKGKSTSLENTVVYPPCGIVPFHGFTMYVTPFCYLYDDPVALYFTFRAFYTRYFFRLHEVSSHEQGILSLCILFERLLQKHEYDLWLHLKGIAVRPTQLVFKWMIKAFSGFLIPDQLLFLWDVILAYDSLEIIPLLAVTILSLRKTNLMAVQTLQGLEAVLADLSTILALPMIQLSMIRFDALHSSKQLVTSEENNNFDEEEGDWDEAEDEEEEESYSSTDSSGSDYSTS